MSSQHSPNIGVSGKGYPFSIKCRSCWDITWDPKMVAWVKVHSPSRSVSVNQHGSSKFSQEQKPSHTARKPRWLCVTVAAVEACCCSMSTLTAEAVLFCLNPVKEPCIFICSSSPHNWARVTNCRLCEFTQFVLCEAWRVLSSSYLSSSSVTLLIFMETLNKTLLERLCLSLNSVTS